MTPRLDRRVRINMPAVPVLLAVLAISSLTVATSNPMLTFVSVSAGMLFYLLLYRPGEPPVLLFALGIQWLQVVTKVFQADALGLPIDDLQTYFGDLSQAVLVALLGLCVLAIGMWLGVGRRRLPSPTQARNEAERFSPFKLWVAYLMSVAVNLVVGDSIPQSSGLYQPMLAALATKWALLFVLAYVVFVRKIGIRYLIASMALEIVTGFGGFFGGFKAVFFVVLIGTMTARVRLTAGRILSMAAIVTLLVVLGICWSAIKVGYREFLNEGSGEQVVTVPAGARFDYLVDAFTRLDSEDFAYGTEKLLERVAYIDIFAAVLDRVPVMEPYAGGALTGGAIQHILMPRLFFPDKPATPSDSEVTRQYAGLTIGGESQGTSISIGYMGEFYADFGPYLMFLPVLALGYLIGWMYVVLLHTGRGSLLMSYGLIAMTFFGLSIFEIALIKLLGSLVMNFLVALVIGRYALPLVEAKLFTHDLSSKKAAI